MEAMKFEILEFQNSDYFHLLHIHVGYCKSFLQRLCEELEYSELLDRVADIDDPCERMVSTRDESFFVVVTACETKKIICTSFGSFMLIFIILSLHSEET
jgi:Oxysterol-binding protein